MGSPAAAFGLWPSQGLKIMYSPPFTATCTPGKYEIDGKDVYASVVEYTTIPWEEAKFEAHENYTDIQYMIKGTELMSYAPIDQLTVKTPYNPDKDVIFYTNDVPGSRLSRSVFLRKSMALA